MFVAGCTMKRQRDAAGQGRGSRCEGGWGREVTVPAGARGAPRPRACPGPAAAQPRAQTLRGACAARPRSWAAGGRQRRRVAWPVNNICYKISRHLNTITCNIGFSTYCYIQYTNMYTIYICGSTSQRQVGVAGTYVTIVPSWFVQGQQGRRYLADGIPGLRQPGHGRRQVELAQRLQQPLLPPLLGHLRAAPVVNMVYVIMIEISILKRTTRVSSKDQYSKVFAWTPSCVTTCQGHYTGIPQRLAM